MSEETVQNTTTSNIQVISGDPGIHFGATPVLQGSRASAVLFELTCPIWPQTFTVRAPGALHKGVDYFLGKFPEASSTPEHLLMHAFQPSSPPCSKPTLFLSNTISKVLSLD